jgi:hypothetical protein
VSPAHANYLVRLSDRLTYRQLVILAFFAQAESGPDQQALRTLVDDMLDNGTPPPDPTLLAEMDDLRISRLLGRRRGQRLAILAT